MPDGGSHTGQGMGMSLVMDMNPSGLCLGASLQSLVSVQCTLRHLVAQDGTMLVLHTLPGIRHWSVSKFQ